jgi:hypothetical protein
MLFLFCSIVLCFLLLAGIGVLLADVLRIPQFRNPVLYFWLGIFATSTAVMLFSLFVALDIKVFLVFVLLGACGIPVFYNSCRQILKEKQAAVVKLFGCALLVLFLALTSMLAYSEWTDSTGSSDTNGYHLPIVRWYNEYGTAAGLGNLHARLAFNSSWLSLAALLDNSLWDNRSAWLMSGLCILGGLAYFLFEFCFASARGARLYAAVILCWLGLTIVHISPTLYYDRPAHILNAIAALEAFYLIGLLSSVRDIKKISGSATVCLMLSVCMFMIKPIGAICVFFTGFLALFALVAGSIFSITNWLKVFLPALTGLAVWIAGNIILSGYPLYPLPVLAWPLDWTMPLRLAQYNYNAVLGWARMAGPDYLASLENGFWFWFKPWLVDNLRDPIFLPLILISLLLWGWNVWHRRNPAMFYFLLWCWAGVVYWFITAPDFSRFGEGFFWIAIASAFLFALPEHSRLDLTVVWQNIALRQLFLTGGLVVVFTGMGIDLFYPGRNLFHIGSTPDYAVADYVARRHFDNWNRACIVEIEQRDKENPARGYRPVQEMR